MVYFFAGTINVFCLRQNLFKDRFHFYRLNCIYKTIYFIFYIFLSILFKITILQKVEKNVLVASYDICLDFIQFGFLKTLLSFCKLHPLKLINFYFLCFGNITITYTTFNLFLIRLPLFLIWVDNSITVHYQCMARV